MASTTANIPSSNRATIGENPGADSSTSDP
jgi:hypothetical protein